ncbi:hypothetical protein DB346_16000 [Verrucomicrobia bacterium LW23]|nr:hypothetical protein DB346_16000 [Verrucomicrobia bacterium LW23]
MTSYLKDNTGTIIAHIKDLRYNDRAKAYVGHLEYAKDQPKLQSLLAKLETLVDGLSLSDIDDVQEEIDRLNIKVRLENNEERVIKDLFVNKENGVSFRVE